jgi:hypothetical protein
MQRDELKIRLTLAFVFAYIKAQELTLKYSGSLPFREKIWYKDKKIIKLLKRGERWLKKSA